MSGSDVVIREVEDYEPTVLQDLVRRNLENNQIYLSTDSCRGQGDERFRPGPVLRLAAFDDGRLVGLSWGQAISATRFAMYVSLVEETHRGRGIYSRLLDTMLESTRHYDDIESHHQLWNNNIIAIKLRRGFHIVGIDHSIAVGPRLILRYYHNQKLLQMMQYRVGLRDRPSGDG